MSADPISQRAAGQASASLTHDAGARGTAPCGGAGAAPLHAEAGSLTATEAYAMDVYTVPASLAGLPALALPTSRSKGGLPLGLQVSSGL